MQNSFVHIVILVGFAAMVTTACDAENKTPTQQAETMPKQAPSPPMEPAKPTQLVTWSQVQALPQPEPGIVQTYGEHPDQYAELFLPSAPPVLSGPPDSKLPVIALLHGGCWLEAFDANYIRPLAAAMAGQGYAVWNIEYRRVSAGEDGKNTGAGGYPETFEDVSAAIDTLRELAPAHNLDLSNITAMGHSAGGHLALWSSLRGKIPAGDAIASTNPVLPSRVIGLAAIADLATYRVGPPNSCHSAVDLLTGGSPADYPERYANTSPLAMVPLVVPATLINGVQDPIVSISSAREAAAADPMISLDAVDGLGHFGLAMTAGAGWDAIIRALE